MTQGSDRRLRRLRLIGIGLPSLFIVGLELVRLTVVDDSVPHRGHLMLGVVALLAVIAFGTTMFYLIDRAHRLVLRQNRELAAVNAVSTAIRGDLDLDRVIDAALDSVLTASGAQEVALTASLPHDVSLNGSVATWRRRANGTVTTSQRRRSAGPAQAIDVPLLAGNDRIGSLSLRLVGGRDGPDKLHSDSLKNIGQQVGSALQAAHLIADLQRSSRENEGIYQVLLQISNQQPLSTTLASLVGVARALLRADEAGLCFDQATAGLVSIDTAMTSAAGHEEMVCITADRTAGCLASGTCPLRQSVGFQTSKSATLHCPGGSFGQLWVARHSDVAFFPRDEEFLATLSELAVVAVNHARMLENERQGAILAERERIAREMHDSLAQVLGVTQLRLRALMSWPQLAGMLELKGELGDLAGICHEGYQDVREAILGLRESSRTDRALLESLRVYVDKFSRQSGIHTVLETKLNGEPEWMRDPLTLTPQCEVQVIRVIHEALTNVRKHSEARSAVVRIAEAPDITTFVVEDDGRGFDTDAVDGEREGFGLHSMRERMRQVDCKLTIDSVPGRGTRVIIGVPAAHRVLPLPREAMQA